MTPQLTTILFVVVAAIAGYILGILDRFFTASLRKQKEAPIAAQVPAPAPSPLGAEHPGEKALLKVISDADMRLHVELDGKRFDKPEDMTLENRQQAVGVVMQLRPWLDVKAAPPAAAAAAPTQAAASQPKLAPAPVSASNPVPLRADPAIPNPVANIGKPVPIKPLSIVGLIDEVLQSRLPETPYKDQGIHLENGPKGDVIVVVGAKSYNGIDAVPEAGIRDVIKAAIAEWEKK